MDKQKNKLKKCNKSIIIILDACRYDAFREVNNLEGNLTKVWSLGSKTPEFYTELEKRELLSDRFALTANPQKWDSEIFQGREILGKSGEFEDTIDPYNSLQKIKESVEEFDKLFIHLVPPHLPWLTEEGKRILKKNNYGKIKFPDGKTPAGITWEEMIYEKVSKSKKYYKDNLRYVLDALKKIKGLLKNDTVITSDHGELIGEHGEFGHNVSNYSSWKELREIPWLEWL